MALNGKPHQLENLPLSNICTAINNEEIYLKKKYYAATVM